MGLSVLLILWYYRCIMIGSLRRPHISKSSVLMLKMLFSITCLSIQCTLQRFCRSFSLQNENIFTKQSGFISSKQTICLILFENMFLGEWSEKIYKTCINNLRCIRGNQRMLKSFLKYTAFNYNLKKKYIYVVLLRRV